MQTEHTKKKHAQTHRTTRQQTMTESLQWWPCSPGLTGSQALCSRRWHAVDRTQCRPLRQQPARSGAGRQLCCSAKTKVLDQQAGGTAMVRDREEDRKWENRAKTSNKKGGAAKRPLTECCFPWKRTTEPFQNAVYQAQETNTSTCTCRTLSIGQSSNTLKCWHY